MSLDLRLLHIWTEVTLLPIPNTVFRNIDSAGSIPGFVRYRSIPEFCLILDTYVM